MSERDILKADRITLGVCEGCGAVQLQLRGLDGEIFAVASLGPAEAARAAEWILEAAEHAPEAPTCGARLCH